MKALRGAMSLLGCLGVLVGLMALGFVGDAHAQSEVRKRVAKASGKPHPYLFLPKEGVPKVKAKIDQSPLLAKAYGAVVAQADSVLTAAPVERRLQGRRLLWTSRDALRRIASLAFVYRMTGEQRYAVRAEEEMLAVAGFIDWNPSHFLDVGEMTAALGIGYDWLYEELSEASRRIIRRAIVEKGLQPSLSGQEGWISAGNNWNQVNHGGLTVGALAVMDEAPALATRIVERAVENIRIPMRENYGSHGGYAEGPSYWYYGTHYNVLLIDALSSALGTEFDLTAIAPFMRSSTFYLHAHAPSLQYYNYSDSDLGAAVAPAMYWFARQRARPELLHMEKRKLERMAEAPPPGAPARTDAAFRFLPMLLVWAEAEQMAAETVPAATHFYGPDQVAVGLHRARWHPNATFVGIEGGAARQSHAQMDAGAFVVESDGVRWALDLPKQSYFELEKAGVDLWNMSQESERWTVYRLNNFSHNTLVVNGQHQRVDGFAPVIAHEADGPRPHTVIDLGAVYDGQLAEAKRGIAVLDGGAGVLIQDEITALADQAAEVRWAMVTEADVEITGAHTATLTQDGKTRRIRLQAPAGTELEVYSTTPPAAYDAANEGTRMIGFRSTLVAREEARFVIVLAEGEASRRAVKPLADW